MSKAWMPLYISDYKADTAHLSAAQHGAYLCLIMHYWSTGGLPQDDAALARIACMTTPEWKRNKSTVAAFFTSKWTHKRIDAELAKAKQLSDKRSAIAKQRHSNSSAIASHLDTQSQSQSPKEDFRAKARSTGYAFEDGVIRLNQRDFEAWKLAFSHLDLAAELLSLSKWAESEEKNWFHAVKGALAKRNREVKERKERPAPDPNEPKWLDGIPGVL